MIFLKIYLCPEAISINTGPPGYLQPTYGRLVGRLMVDCTEEVLVNAVCQGEAKGRQ